jgi:hypothetical protein
MNQVVCTVHIPSTRAYDRRVQQAALGPDLAPKVFSCSPQPFFKICCIWIRWLFVLYFYTDNFLQFQFLPNYSNLWKFGHKLRSDVKWVCPGETVYLKCGPQSKKDGHSWPMTYEVLIHQYTTSWLLVNCNCPQTRP